MTTQHPRVTEFNEKLKALLAEYKAEISLETTWSGYSHWTEIEVSFEGYTEGETYVQAEIVESGSYIDSERGILS